MSPQHTEGPWEVENYRGRANNMLRIKAGYLGIARVNAGIRDVANARVIAAAPELLAAAIDLVAAHEDTAGIDFVGWCQLLAEKVEHLRAAIAKAKGPQS